MHPVTIVIGVVRATSIVIVISAIIIEIILKIVNMLENSR
jgi:hypothetical protein